MDSNPTANRTKGTNTTGLEETFNFGEIGTAPPPFINQQTPNYSPNETESHSALHKDTKDTSGIGPTGNTTYGDSPLDIDQTPTPNSLDIRLLDHTETNPTPHTMINPNINIDTLIIQKALDLAYYTMENLRTFIQAKWDAAEAFIQKNPQIELIHQYTVEEEL